MLFQEKVKINRDAFLKRVAEVASNCNMQPEWLMAIMNFETAGTFSPSIKNPSTGATGLIQFMPATAKEMGTTTDALAQKTNVQQLDDVERYFRMQIRRYGTIDNVAEAYLAVFYPAAIAWPMERQFPAAVYRQNKVFDLNSDGTLTKTEIIQKIVSTIPAAYRNAIVEKKTL
mgnify:CR=1 FL=1